MERVKEYILDRPDDKQNVGLNEISADLGLTKKETATILTDLIEETLQENPDGLTITDLTQMTRINRNWLAKRLEILELIGRVERKKIGPAKLFKWSEEGINRWEKYYRALIQNSNDVILVVNFERTNDPFISFVSQSAIEIVGYPPENLKNRGYLSYLHQEDLGIVDQLRRLNKGESQQKTLNFRLRHQSGEWRYIEGRINDQRTNKEIHGFVINCIDVTENIILQEQIQFRIAFEKMILDIATSFIDVPHEQTAPVLFTALSFVGRFLVQNRLDFINLAPDRITLFLFANKEKKFRKLHEWQPDGTDVSPAFPEINLKSFVHFDKMLRSGEMLHYGKIESFPVEAEKERALLQKSGVKSFIGLPLKAEKDVFYGFIGFEFVSHEIRHYQNMLDILQSFTKIINTMLGRLHSFVSEDLNDYLFRHLK